jgi:hypothetical protein
LRLACGHGFGFRRGSAGAVRLARMRLRATAPARLCGRAMCRSHPSKRNAGHGQWRDALRLSRPTVAGSPFTFEAFRSVPTSAPGPVAPGVSTALDPAVASNFAMLRSEGNPSARPRVYRLWHRTDRPGVVDLTGNESPFEVFATLRDAFDNGYDAITLGAFYLASQPAPREPDGPL